MPCVDQFLFSWSQLMHNLLIVSSFVATLVIPCLFAAFPGKNEVPTNF